MNLPNREELWLLVVAALPKASKTTWDPEILRPRGSSASGEPLERCFAAASASSDTAA